jgi:hypothetical protein
VTDLDDRLSAQARAAVERARAYRLSYGVRILLSPDEPQRALVVVGEAHLKLRRASEVGKQLVSAYELRGVEGFPRKKVASGQLLGILIEGPRTLLRIVTLGLVKDSTIRDAVKATHGRTFRLEMVSRVPLALHVAIAYLSAFFVVMFAALLLPLFEASIPSRLVNPLAQLAFAFECHLPALIPALLLQRRRWSWLLYPAIAILTERNRMMAEGTVTMLRENLVARSALVIMGRAHLPGYERELVEKYGFTRVAAMDGWTRRS